MEIQITEKAPSNYERKLGPEFKADLERLLTAAGFGHLPKVQIFPITQIKGSPFHKGLSIKQPDHHHRSVQFQAQYGDNTTSTLIRVSCPREISVDSFHRNLQAAASRLRQKEAAVRAAKPAEQKPVEPIPPVVEKPSKPRTFANGFANDPESVELFLMALIEVADEDGVVTAEAGRNCLVSLGVGPQGSGAVFASVSKKHLLSVTGVTLGDRFQIPADVLARYRGKVSGPEAPTAPVQIETPTIALLDPTAAAEQFLAYFADSEQKVGRLKSLETEHAAALQQQAAAEERVRELDAQIRDLQNQHAEYQARAAEAGRRAESLSTDLQDPSLRQSAVFYEQVKARIAQT
jgi:hypothetical protein